MLMRNLALATMLVPATPAHASCGSSWQICAYRAHERAAWRAQHPGVLRGLTRRERAFRENQWLRHGQPIRNYI
jgi:hypothetical protein